MKKLLSLLVLVCLEKSVHAQYIYTIKADSVKITNSCDTAELIIENHTQTVPGFLFNKGRGRTEFRRALFRLSDSTSLIGCDTLKLNAWLQGGNTFGTTGYFGTRDYNHIDFYTNAIKRGRWTNTGNFLVGGDTDYGYKMAVHGPVYGQYFTNSTTPLSQGDGALRLRWGGGGGSYIDFYNDEDQDLRGRISSGADGRPLVLYDRIGLTLDKTPFLSIGTEWPTAANVKFSLTTAFNSTQDPMRVANLTSAADDSYSTSYLRVKASGNTILGEGDDDNEHKLQINGPAYIRNYLTVGNDIYKVRAFSNFNNVYGDNIAGSLIMFGSPGIFATIGVNVQAVGNIPEQSMIIGGASPGHYTTLIDYARNPAFIVNGNGAVTINGGHSGITSGVGVGVNANAIRFNINGGLGTGNGEVGDIYFSTGNAQASGSTKHTLTTRWIIKGGTGFLSNHEDPKSQIDINGDNGYSQLRLRTSFTPSSSSDNHGNTGDVSWDNNYIYIKTTSGWKRSALETF